MNRTPKIASFTREQAMERMPDVQILLVDGEAVEGLKIAAYLEPERGRYTFARFNSAECLVWWAFYSGWTFAQWKAGADGAANPPGWSSE